MGKQWVALSRSVVDWMAAVKAGRFVSYSKSRDIPFCSLIPTGQSINGLQYHLQV
jgi:hypothetical protein